MGIWGVLNRKIGSRIRVPPIDFGGLDKNLLLIKNINQRGPPCTNREVLGAWPHEQTLTDVGCALGSRPLLPGPRASGRSDGWARWIFGSEAWLTDPRKQRLCRGSRDEVRGLSLSR